MRAYNNACGGCFHGDGLVLMADGSRKAVRDVRKGDWLALPPAPDAVGASEQTAAQVTCAVQIHTDGGSEELVQLEGSGLRLTPWHPVRVDGRWQFPCALACARRVPCDAVYDFVLSEGHVMEIDGVQCVTLGHGFQGAVIGHAYFGTDRVVDDLRAMRGWEAGLVELHASTCNVRDPETRKICGFRQQPPKQQTQQHDWGVL